MVFRTTGRFFARAHCSRRMIKERLDHENNVTCNATQSSSQKQKLERYKMSMIFFFRAKFAINSWASSRKVTPYAGYMDVILLYSHRLNNLLNNDRASVSYRTITVNTMRQCG